MLVSEAIQLAAAIHRDTPVAGFSGLKYAQLVADETYRLESNTFLRSTNYLVTVAGQLGYTFEELFPLVLTRIRVIKGLWDPALASQGASNYGNDRAPFGADQTLDERRIYTGKPDVSIDNLERTVTFSSDPGDTTAKWKADYYLTAPILTESSRVPVLPGWEGEIFVNGIYSYYEFYDKYEWGNSRGAFLDALEVRYLTALDNHAKPQSYNSVQGFKTRRYVRSN